MEASRTGLRLWEIADELGEIAEQLVETEGELTPAIEAKLDALEGSFDEKVERVALYAQQCKANAAGSKVEEDRLKGMRTAYENREAGMKRYLHAVLERARRDKVVTSKVRVRLQDNSQGALTFDGEVLNLPDELQKVTVEPNFALVRERLKADPDAQLPKGFTYTRGFHVRIF